MRVGLRRMRAALSLFKVILGDRQTESLKDELKWLTQELGPAREFEVLMNRVVKPATKQKQKLHRNAVSSICRQVAARREAALSRAQAAVESERFRLLMLDIAAWLEIGQWVNPKDDLVRERGEVTIDAFANEQLSRRWRKICKKRKSFANLDSYARHKLRIQAKKLRYAVDFFTDLFSGSQVTRRRKKFLSSLGRVQDCLGDLNDIAVHENLIIDRILRLQNTRKGAFAAGLLTGLEDSRQSGVMASASKALNSLAKAKPFWL
jgi:CHAD domain-containing protein